MFRFFSNLSNRAVLVILLAVGLSSSVASFIVNIINNVDTSSGWWTSWLQNFSTEMFGAFLTFILFELIIGSREKQQEQERILGREKTQRDEAVQQEKTRLIRQMRSSVNQEAIRAVEELRAYGWSIDGSLRGVELSGANLQGANLSRSDLRRVNLWAANLEGANLLELNLHMAALQIANLQEADLSCTNLEGADLWNTNLKWAILWQAKFDETTILPDRSNWTPETDMTRFTDPNHPHFWRSDNSSSPAYRAKEA
ncbi:MAG: pentapeptide repeat-containing protein [Anaerolineae bacterium]|nr:pentapeptide repeat-containing protein [Anaerolineae bacterium]